MAKSKKPVLRRCVVCHEEKPKSELLRVVAPPDSEGMTVDLTGKLPGRGAYLCIEGPCREKAIKQRAFARALKRPQPPELAEELTAALEAIEEAKKEAEQAAILEARRAKPFRLGPEVRLPELKDSED